MQEQNKTTSSSMGRMWIAVAVALSTVLGTLCWCETAVALSTLRAGAVKGAAATPAIKKKIAVLGSGGYLGATTFGFLQRAASLYGTGIGNCRCIGATPDTSVRLNRILSKHFCLAQADESVIKLTDLTSVEAIASRLKGWDALILGSNLFLEQRPVASGTYERNPNDKAWEVYWDEPKGSFSDLDLSREATEAKDTLLQNIVAAAKLANVKHLVVVDDGSLLPLLESSKVMYTCIRPPQLLTDTPNFSFKDGVVNDLTILSGDGIALNDPKMSTSSPSVCCREDLAALCVQSLLSLSWDQSRVLNVSSNGPVVELSIDPLFRPELRVDQQWCVNSVVLEEKLSRVP